MSKLCKDCACEYVCGITHMPEFDACENYKADAITELEEIKAEICKKHRIDCDLKCRECIYYPCLDSGASYITDIKILDKHIKKLKGENNVSM